jgi:DNA-binding transcriptional MerR regulator
MAVEVEFITLGDASDRLGIPASTLRHWTDQMEEFNVHYVMRNNRNERIYYDTDLDIFEFLRDLKNEHGRRTTTKDLALMIREMKDRFELRAKEDAPMPSNPSNKTAELLNQEDIKQLMQSERVKQFIGIVIAENTNAMRKELIEEVRESVRKELRTEMDSNHQKMEEVANRIEDGLKKRDEQMNTWISEMREERKNKGFFARLFGG